MDFANKYLGGGTLGSGCVQEEIRFLVCPELILSQLIVEELDPDECLIIVGAERYSNYSGYGSTFKFAGNYVDRTPRDAWGRKCVEVVAMDALRFTVSAKQYTLKNIQRELNKAYCAFHRIEPGARHDEDSTTATTPAKEATADASPSTSSRDGYRLPAVATGNWGCGAFGGDPYLKSLIQLMAAAEAERDVAYFTFGDRQLAQDIHRMHDYLVENEVTVGDLWRFFRDIDRRAMDRNYDKRELKGRGLFGQLMQWWVTSKDSETESEESWQSWQSNEGPTTVGEKEEGNDTKPSSVQLEEGKAEETPRAIDAERVGGNDEEDVELDNSRDQAAAVMYADDSSQKLFTDDDIPVDSNHETDASSAPFVDEETPSTLDLGADMASDSIPK